MQISTRFTVALHIFACVEAFSGKYKVTSDFLAASINTNPVIVRKILGQLSRSGLISVARGTAELNWSVLRKKSRFMMFTELWSP